MNSRHPAEKEGPPPPPPFDKAWKELWKHWHPNDWF